MNKRHVMSNINQRFNKWRAIRNKAKQIQRWEETKDLSDLKPIIDSFWQAANDGDAHDCILYHHDIKTKYWRDYR